MEASTLAHASRRGLLARRSPLLRLEGDERLVALIRTGHDRAFEALFDRYHARLLAFCTSMLKSRQDAEDVLQEVFANAHRAMLADDRKLNVRPWLYRIARNRCLNHLRRPVPEGQDSMDVHPHQHGATTAERVQTREELRQVLADVGILPETQRTALLLREIDQLSYEEIAVTMDTTIPAVKSLLVRARIMLAESSEARTLSCDEVRLELAEAAEGIRKVSGPVRHHLRTCDGCRGFREQLRSDRKALAAILPIGPLAVLKSGFLGKLFGGAGGGSTAGGTAVAVGGTAATGTAGGLGALSGALGTKAAAGIATAALLTAGAVEVGGSRGSAEPPPAPASLERTTVADPGTSAPAVTHKPRRSKSNAAAAPPPAATSKPSDEPRAAGREAPATAPAVEPVAGGASSAGDPAGGSSTAPAAGGSEQWGGGETTDPPPAAGAGGGLERPAPDESVPTEESPPPPADGPPDGGYSPAPSAPVQPTE